MRLAKCCPSSVVAGALALSTVLEDVRGDAFDAFSAKLPGVLREGNIESFVKGALSAVFKSGVEPFASKDSVALCSKGG